jgi:hypothetical protein
MQKFTSKFHKKIVLTLISLLLLGVGSVPLASHVAASTSGSGTGIIIPLYIYPGSAWNTIIQSKQSNPTVPITVVVNPGNGPGSSKSATYASWIPKMQAAGITVIGYVPTSYAARSTSSIESNISTYKSWYAVNGIFLDEMSNKAGYESYYSSLTAYAHSIGLPLVVGNPGTHVPSAYFGTVDELLVYENPGMPSMSTLSSYTAGGTKSEFALTSYSIASLTTPEVSLLGNYAASFYITSGVWPSPYSTLPSYFPTLVSDVKSFLATTTPLVVQTVDTTGKAVDGLFATVSSGGNVVAEGFTPFTFLGTTGGQYTVTISNYESQIFSHWQDGSTNPSQSVTLTKPTTITASFSTTLSIAVNAVTSSGAALTGLMTVVYSQGSVVDQGFTPLTYIGSPGASYKVCVENYQSDIFSHWNGGSTSACETVTLSQDLQLTATYST